VEEDQHDHGQREQDVENNNDHGYGCQENVLERSESGISIGGFTGYSEALRSTIEFAMSLWNRSTPSEFR
jgi:hypothetical protein